MITKTYMIPEENIENLKKKFNAAARKIRKINTALEPMMTEDNHTIVLVRKIELRPCDCRSESTVKKVPYEARKVELKIPEEAVFAENNWAFGGSVEPSGVDGKNFVNVNLSGKDLGFIVPTRYFSSNPCSCDYCKTDRKRSKTYLVVNRETGEWKQVCDEFARLEADALRQFVSLPENMRDAYRQLDAKTEVTDDCQAAELAGIPVKIVENFAPNFKLTTPADMQLLALLLK